MSLVILKQKLSFTLFQYNKVCLNHFSLIFLRLNNVTFHEDSSLLSILTKREKSLELTFLKHSKLDYALMHTNTVKPVLFGLPREQ